MKHQYLLRITACLLPLLLSLPGMVLSADLRSAILANPCAGCHGTNGNSTGSIPALSKLSENEIREELQKFKTDKRAGTVMNRIAKGYTDEEIDLIAKQFAAYRQ